MLILTLGPLPKPTSCVKSYYLSQSCFWHLKLEQILVLEGLEILQWVFPHACVHMQLHMLSDNTDSALEALL